MKLLAFVLSVLEFVVAFKLFINPDANADIALLWFAVATTTLGLAGSE